ncbi:MAG: hypothetical protein ACXWZE_09080, partial [Candidatus Binatia bacterium]
MSADRNQTPEIDEPRGYLILFKYFLIRQERFSRSMVANFRLPTILLRGRQHDGESGAAPNSETGRATLA